MGIPISLECFTQLFEAPTEQTGHRGHRANKHFCRFRRRAAVKVMAFDRDPLIFGKLSLMLRSFRERCFIEMDTVRGTVHFRGYGL